MKIVVPVTQEDIDKGVPGNESFCALARAIDRAIGAPTAEVSDGRIDFQWQGEVVTCVTDDDVKQFIEDFDHEIDDPESEKIPVYPCTLILDLEEGIATIEELPITQTDAT